MNGQDDRDDELASKIDALPRAIEPGRDLWRGVATRIEAQQRRASRRRRALAGGAAAVAASLALAATYLVLVRAPKAPHEDRAPIASVAPAPPVPAPIAPPKALVPEEDSYRAALAALVPTFQARKALLPAEDAKRIDASLHAIEAAIGATRAALTAQPDDPDLRAELDAEYEQEIQTMNDVLEWTTRS